MADKWRTIRIFISSTFRDMHAERDHIARLRTERDVSSARSAVARSRYCVHPVGPSMSLERITVVSAATL